ncbi:MAG: YbaN family protein [Candidatus Aminicenantales bacterium]
MTRLTKSVLMVCGTLCVAFGAVGVFVPILPTTPFLLLAAICYARSSARLYHWLLNNRWFGEYIRNYREGRGLPLRLKILTILTLWLTIGLSAFFAVSSLWSRVILFLIMGGVTLHLVTIKTSPCVASRQRTRDVPSADEPDRK